MKRYLMSFMPSNLLNSGGKLRWGEEKREGLAIWQAASVGAVYERGNKLV